MQTVPDIIQLLSESSEELTILKYENILIRMFLSPILLIASLSNFVIMHYIRHQSNNIVVTNSLFLLGFGILIEFISRSTINERFKENFFTAFFSLVQVFVVIRFYHLIGATVWLISILIVMISMLRLRKSMLIITSLTILLLIMYVWWYRSNPLNWGPGSIYYILQIATFITLFIIAAGVHKLIVSRFNKIYEQFQFILKSQNELGIMNASLKEEIEEHINTENALRSSEHTFRTIFEGSSDPILIMRGDKFIDCNPATIEILGYASIIGKCLWDISPNFQKDGLNSKEKALKIIHKAQNTRKTKLEWWFEKKDGVLLPVEVMLTPIELRGEKVLHVLWRDISERKKMEKHLEYLSYHDQLTGLYNRRFFEEKLISLNTQEELPFTIVMADVNGLKLINDSFGHNQGDKLLQKVADVIKSGCRLNDIFARFGGDEFVILMTRTNAEETEKLVKRIKAQITKEQINTIDISVSFGYETKVNEEEAIQEIFKKAEDHMYKNKLLESPSMRGKTIKVIIKTLYEKNEREELHSRRVSEVCRDIGKALNLPEAEVEELRVGGLLHDIGKIAIEESILSKTSKLTEDERKEIKRHPEIGYRILSSVNDMSEISEYVLAHHERWDGKGYPKGLKGEEIPLQSRIIALADTYDAIVSERSYRDAQTVEVSVQEIRKNSGSQFDPMLAKIFVEKVLGQCWE